MDLMLGLDSKITTIQTTKIKPLIKYKVLHFKKNVLFNLDTCLKNLEHTTKCFTFVKKAKHIDVLTKASGEPFNIFEYNFPLGFFAGCVKFSFRVTFKEYKVGLKAAKYSLLLNQFKLNINLFIDLITEILVNNFPLSFYEEFVGSDLLNDWDLKIHFLVVMRSKALASKFFIILKGGFFTHLREQIWFTLFSDFVFIFCVSSYYKRLRTPFFLMFLLIVYYVYKLINKYKIYDIDTRAYDSLGNILVLQNSSFNLYLKNSFKVNRYSFLCSAKSLSFLMDEDLEQSMGFTEINSFRKAKFNLENFYDLVSVDEDLNLGNEIN